MADINVTWNPAAMAGDDIAGEADNDAASELVTAVAISLFTHRTALEDDRLPDEASTDRRGWWADHEADAIYPGATPIGSRLWLLKREKQTEETRLRAHDYIVEALAWMTDIGIATQVDVVCEWFAFERLGAVVTIYRGPRRSIAVRFEKLWDALAA